MSSRFDPRQAKLDVRAAAQKRPESVPLPSRTDRPSGSAGLSQLLRSDATGLSASAALSPPTADENPSSLGFQPYRPIATSRSSAPLARSDPMPSYLVAASYAPAVAQPPLGDGLAGFDGSGMVGSTSGAPVDWESRDEMRQRELDEMRARVTQMEKTMRWWSDCTANWREKWSKVRGERNKARDECRQLRARLDEVMKECAQLKREKLELVTSSANSSAAAAAAAAAPLAAPIAVSGMAEEKAAEAARHDAPHALLPSTSHGDSNQAAPPRCDEPLPSLCRQCGDKVTPVAEAATTPERRQSSSPDLAVMLQREREEKVALAERVDTLDRELEAARDRLSRHSAVAADRPDFGVEEEAAGATRSVSSVAEKQLAELRTQLEMLQMDNATEWARRERTDSERYALERDNKKLKSHLDDLRQELDRCSTAVSGIKEGEVKAVQKELGERNKELVELRHSHAKHKRLLQERTLELEHSKRRAEQYEAEVRKLRGRVDDLKRELAETQDELDTQSNSNKKLQRTVDELQETNESLGIQLEHAQSRLKSNTGDALGYFKSRLVKSGIAAAVDEDSTDAFDESDGDEDSAG